ncbi:MAG TPA: RNA polymerase sigma-70 factor [Pirellulaceae bacterium]|nr:RNA polymerase sigma-70 factor [Pirellulaceae bacterium]
MHSSDEPTSEPAAAALRSRLMALAYRMLGTVADAEDAVQDAYLRFQQADNIAAPDAWLVKTTTRLCIDRLRQTKRRAQYIGPWLPEPIAASWGGVARDQLELGESLSVAFLLLLETLSPAERAAYLLREVFAYDFEEIATLLEKSAVNVRQITARAKKRLNQPERRFETDTQQAYELAQRFFAACQAGDIHAIEALLAQDVVFYSDGGGKTRAAPQPIRGAYRIAHLFAVVFRRRAQTGELQFTTVNGQPGVVFSAAGRALQVLTLSTKDGRIQAFYGVLNPDKLQRWPALITKPPE